MADRSHWVALLSGGKDSSWALHSAQERDLPVTHLLTATPRGDSYLFHVPAVSLTPLIAEAIGLPLRTFPIEPPQSDDATIEGEQELAALRAALTELRAELPGELAGIVTGAVASRFQYDRLSRLCEEFAIKQFAPLWSCDPEVSLRMMIDAGFDIRIVAVAAGGFDQSWLNRSIDAETLDDLIALREMHGIHVMGEGGEYETVVVDGPHMSASIGFTATEHWDGTRGHLEITDAWIER